MDPPPRPSTSLFEVYLRLRPSHAQTERFLDVEPSEHDATHITIKPPSGDHRKRAVEKFAFTRVFEERASQLDIFKGVGVLPLIRGAVGADGREGRDGLLATLGVTGSGKSHTILGSKSQRGMTQMTLDVLFNSLSSHIADPNAVPSVYPSLAAADVSEAQLLPASVFLDTIYGDAQSTYGGNSRAQTPMMVLDNFPFSTKTHVDTTSLWNASIPIKFAPDGNSHSPLSTFSPVNQSHVSDPPHVSRAPSTSRFARVTRSFANRYASLKKDGASFLSVPQPAHRRAAPRPSALPQLPNVSDITVDYDASAEYAIVISMYEVYNDRIYDLLANVSSGAKFSPQKRRPLLFKSTEKSPERKVVAGLRKVICGTLEDALIVLETGLLERKVAGTGSNAVSSRSHGFFCVEVKKRRRSSRHWSSSTLSIVDLAGSERARNAKTAGATLAEAGKINESLMYLGQCMQLQSDAADNPSKILVPFRQCKLTELLFSNVFTQHTQPRAQQQQPQHQKSIMIVTADPVGDFNATSQILRYSALAREVTVPRVPSVTSQILSAAGIGGSPSKGGSTSGRSSPASSPEAAAELATALQALARVSEEADILALRLEEEETRRRAAEASWRAAETHMLALEADLRETLADEFEARLEKERMRWKGAWDEEADRSDEKMDRKIEILSRVGGGRRVGEEQEEEEVRVYEDPEPGVEERARALAEENEGLKRKIEMLEREGQLRSPTKKQRVLKARKWEVDVGEESA